MRNNKQFGPIVDAHLPHLRPPHHQGGCDKAACKFDHDLCLLTQYGVKSFLKKYPQLYSPEFSRDIS